MFGPAADVSSQAQVYSASILRWTGVANEFCWPAEIETASLPILEDLNAPTDGNEKATLVPKGSNPANLRQPTLNAPVVGRASEQFLRLLT